MIAARPPPVYGTPPSQLGPVVVGERSRIWVTDSVRLTDEQPHSTPTRVLVTVRNSPDRLCHAGARCAVTTMLSASTARVAGEQQGTRTVRIKLLAAAVDFTHGHLPQGSQGVANGRPAALIVQRTRADRYRLAAQ